MIVVIIAILGILAIKYPKSRFVSLLIGCFMWISYSFVYIPGDLQTYSRVYMGYISGEYTSTYEPLFSMILRLCARAGFSFTHVRMLLGMIFVICVFSAIIRLTEKRALGIFAFLVFPFFLFVSILRNGIACAVILLAYSFLMDKKKRAFVLCVLVATLFHYSSIVFLSLVLFRKKVNNKVLFGCFSFMMACAVLVCYTTIPFLIVSKFTSREKILQWFVKGNATANITGALVIFALIVMNLLIAYSAYHLAKKGGTGSNQSLSIIDLSYKASVCMLFLIPFAIVSSPFMRLAYINSLVTTLACIEAFDLRNQYIYARFHMKAKSLLVWVGAYVMPIIWCIYADLPYIKTGNALLKILLIQ